MGHERYQVAVLNVSSTGAASLAPWYSPFHLRASQPGVGASPCSAAQPVWVRDVDWAPDGTWWALAGPAATTRTRALRLGEPLDQRRQRDARPVWINYSGGDTFLSVRVTGQHVYVGGHFRELDHAVYRFGKKVNFVGHVHYGLGVIAATYTSGMSVSGWNDGSTTGRGAGWAAMLPNPGASGTRQRAVGRRRRRHDQGRDRQADRPAAAPVTAGAAAAGGARSRRRGVAEADGNRTRLARIPDHDGFEDRGGHQAPYASARAR